MEPKNAAHEHAAGQARGRVMGGLVPGVVHGSPADMRAAPLDALTPEFATIFDPATPWFRPGWREAVLALRWRLVLLIPALAVVVGLPIAVVLLPGLSRGALGAEIKLWIFAAGVVVSLVIWGFKNATTSRRDDFCIHCGYTLDGLGEAGSCPECGRPFTLGVVREYRKDPHFFADRWRALKTAPKNGTFVAGTGPTPDDGTR